MVPISLAFPVSNFCNMCMFDFLDSVKDDMGMPFNRNGAYGRNIHCRGVDNILEELGGGWALKNAC